VYKLGYRFAWCTKYRRKWFIQPWNRKMIEMLHRVSREHDFDLQHLEVMPDHIHCFVGAPPSTSPANIARILKGASSRMFLHENPSFRRIMCGSEHLWNPSYYVGSVGDMSRAIVLKYIARQRQDA
jgi:putative transposase